MDDYTCAFCGAEFGAADAMNDHYNNEHPNEDA